MALDLAIQQTTTLIDCSNEWYVTMDRRIYTLIVFLDIKKPFGTVNQNIFLKKLEMYGSGDPALVLLRNYLCNSKIPALRHAF